MGGADQSDVDLMSDLSQEIFNAGVLVSTLRPCRILAEIIPLKQV